MKSRKISWIDGNFDMESEGEPILIEQDWGNKGIGGIVFILCLMAVLLPSIPTLIQISKGTAKGNPVGAIIAVVVIFSWPLYCGLNQFFLKRHLIISDRVVKFELISILRKRKYEVNIRDYGQIEFGKSESQSRTESGPGKTGKYFIQLPHIDRKCAIILYENVGGPLSEDRMKKYSKRLNLPLIDVTPENTRKAREFKRKVKSILSERKND